MKHLKLILVFCLLPLFAFGQGWQDPVPKRTNRIDKNKVVKGTIPDTGVDTIIGPYFKGDPDPSAWIKYLGTEYRLDNIDQVGPDQCYTEFIDAPLAGSAFALDNTTGGPSNAGVIFGTSQIFHAPDRQIFFNLDELPEGTRIKSVSMYDERRGNNTASVFFRYDGIPTTLISPATHANGFSTAPRTATFATSILVQEGVPLIIVDPSQNHWDYAQGAGSSWIASITPGTATASGGANDGVTSSLTGFNATVTFELSQGGTYTVRKYADGRSLATKDDGTIIDVTSGVPGTWTACVDTPEGVSSDPNNILVEGSDGKPYLKVDTIAKYVETLCYEDAGTPFVLDQDAFADEISSPQLATLPTGPHMRWTAPDNRQLDQLEVNGFNGTVDISWTTSTGETGAQSVTFSGGVNPMILNLGGIYLPTGGTIDFTLDAISAGQMQLTTEATSIANGWTALQDYSAFANTSHWATRLIGSENVVNAEVNVYEDISGVKTYRQMENGTLIDYIGDPSLLSECPNFELPSTISFSEPGKALTVMGDVDIDGTLDPDGLVFDDKGRYTDVATAQTYFTGKGLDFSKTIWVNPEGGKLYRGGTRVECPSADTTESLIFRHHIGNAGVFTSLTEVETVNSNSTDPASEDKFSNLANLEDFRSSDGLFRFRLRYTEFNEEIVWTQTNNPVTDKANNLNADVAQGVNIISSTSSAVLGTSTSAFGGFNNNTSPNTYYDLNPGATWWYPIGQTALFSGGMPAWNAGVSIVTNEAIEIYVTKVTTDQSLVSSDDSNILTSGTDGGVFLHKDSIPEVLNPASYSKKEIWLKIGQSNSVGTDGGGPIDHNGLDAVHPKVFEYSRGLDKSVYRAAPAGELMAYRNPAQDDSNGIGFGQLFGKTRVELNPEIEELIIINRGVGGTGFAGNRWNPGDDLYTLAVNDLKQALTNYPDAVFKGIIWHQGESDAGQGQAFYEAALAAMVEGIRKEAQNTAPGRAEGVFICGTMVETWIAANEADRRPIDLAHRNVANYIENSSFADFSDLIENQDVIHFGTNDLREMGRRYAREAQKIVVKVFPSYRIKIQNGEVVDLFNGGGKVFDIITTTDAERGEVLNTDSRGFQTSMILNNEQYTKSGWINIQAVPTSYGNFISGLVTGGTTAAGHYWGWVGSGQGGSTTSANSTGLNANATLGNWVHATLTSDGTNHELFIDGISAATEAIGNVISPPQLVELGTFAGNNNNPLNALIDDIVILPYALNAEGALSLYQLVQQPTINTTDIVVKGTGDASASPYGVTTTDGKWNLSFGDQNGITPRVTNVSGSAMGLTVHYHIVSGFQVWAREYQNNNMANGGVDQATQGSSWGDGATFGDVSIRATWQDSDGDFYEGLILRSSQLNSNNPIFVKVEKLN